MKKIFLAFALLPIFSFAQIQDNNQRKGIFDSSIIKESNDPAVFINGARVDKNIFSKLNPDDIKYITVNKTDKNYPNGKIEVVLKKDKKS